MKGIFDFEMLTFFEEVDHNFHFFIWIKPGEVIEGIVSLEPAIFYCHEGFLHKLVLSEFELVLPMRAHQAFLVHVLSNPLIYQLGPCLLLLRRITRVFSGHGRVDYHIWRIFRFGSRGCFEVGSCFFGILEVFVAVAIDVGVVFQSHVLDFHIFGLGGRQLKMHLR